MCSMDSERGLLENTLVNTLVKFHTRILEHIHDVSIAQLFIYLILLSLFEQ